MNKNRGSKLIESTVIAYFLTINLGLTIFPHLLCSVCLFFHRNTYEKFSSIYSVSKVSGQLVIPETFQVKLLKWLGNDEELMKEARLQVREYFTG